MPPRLTPAAPSAHNVDNAGGVTGTLCASAKYSVAVSTEYEVMAAMSTTPTYLPSLITQRVPLTSYYIVPT